MLVYVLAHQSHRDRSAALRCPESRVQALYKRAEIPANKVVPAIAVSVTYSKQEKAANTGSIPVSATNSF
jgi:hypothetical protein